ncbi:MAG: hypothetical protein WBA61_02855 [Aequorivita sp.]
MSKDVTRIELAKALKAIQAISTDEQFEKAKRIYIQEGGEESVMSAVNGLSEEDEFAMLTKLMGTATHIIGQEQRPIIKGPYIVPDFFLNLKMGNSVNGKSVNDFSEFKCLMEVKSTEKDKFKIGGSRLQRLRNISDLMGFPLLFAIRFLRAKQNALWAIVEDDRSNTILNVTYQGVIDGVRNVIWNEYTLMINPKLIVKCEFSKSTKINSISHPIYGQQVSATYTDGNKTLTQKEEAFMTCGLLETYNLEEIKVEKISDDITIQYLKPKIPVAFLADLIYKMNNLIVDEFGNIVYDASKLVVRSDTGAHDTLINRKMIELIAKPLVDENLLFIGAIGDLEKQFGKWKEFGGK